MAIDIFNVSKSVIANGLEGKVILIYGGNNLGKSAQATRFPKPFVIACEMGLNGQDKGIKSHGMYFYALDEQEEYES